MTTWYNGEIVEELRLAIAERGLALGDGVFETIRVQDGKSIWLAEHLARLTAAAAELGIELPKAKLDQGLAAVLDRSQFPYEVLRITLTRGATERGLARDGNKPSLIISLGPFTPIESSVKLATSQIRRSDSSPACRLKTLSYIDNIMAARAAKPHADDALMLTNEGNVSGSTIANIFILRGKTLITPSLDQAILPGITRAKILQLGFSCVERKIEPAEVFDAEAVFLSNSLRLVSHVTAIDGKACGMADISHISQALEGTF